MTLSDRHLQLLTAFVDGELTRRQRKAALRLLHRSSEARLVLRDLQENVHRLKKLPRHNLGPQFAEEVLLAIAEHTPSPSSAPPKRRAPRWLKFVAAAACFVLIVGAFYLAGRRSEGEPDRTRQPDGGVRIAFKEIGTDSKLRLFARELENRDAVHLHFAVKNNDEAISRLANAMKVAGVRATFDSRAMSQMERADGKTQYLVYAENLKPAELQGILRQLAASDTKTPGKRTFESVAVSSLSTEHRQTLTGIFGSSDEGNLFDKVFIKAPKDKKGKEDEAPSSLFTQSEGYAVILTNSGRTGGLSPEIKSFLAQRQAHRPGTVQVLMVISQA